MAAPGMWSIKDMMVPGRSQRSPVAVTASSPEPEASLNSFHCTLSHHTSIATLVDVIHTGTPPLGTKSKKVNSTYLCQPIIIIYNPKYILALWSIPPYVNVHPLNPECLTSCLWVVWQVNSIGSPPNGDKRYPSSLSSIFRRSDQAFLLLMGHKYKSIIILNPYNIIESLSD